jgi:uncharacterized damage-inducible protein DinB
MDFSRSAVDELLAFHYDRRGRLYDYVDGLPPAEVLRPVACPWGSVLGLLVHGLNSEDYWVQHVLRRGPQPHHTVEQFPDMAAVRKLAADVHDRTMGFVLGLSDEDLQRDVPHEWPNGTVVRVTPAQVMLQVVTHEVYHRGQVFLLAMMEGREAPDLDYL